LPVQFPANSALKETCLFCVPNAVRKQCIRHIRVKFAEGNLTKKTRFHVNLLTTKGCDECISKGVIIIQFTGAVTIVSVLDGVTCHIASVNSVQHALGHYHSVT
jgi:hypothetical protein